VETEPDGFAGDSDVFGPPKAAMFLCTHWRRHLVQQTVIAAVVQGLLRQLGMDEEGMLVR
jgi:hypothetical protein